MNALLYGHNSDERIVAVHQQDDRTMRTYFRTAEGIREESQPFFPFFHLVDETFLERFPKKHWVKRLDGSGYYQYLCVFEEWGTMWEAIRSVLDRFNQSALTKAASYQDVDLIYLQADPVTQYLMQSGRTLFKGMGFGELHRLQLDIETYTSARYRFSNPARPGDRIILIALADNRGWTHLIDGRSFTEPHMLEELIRIIRTKDPDILEGHNILAFDLPYILKRCELNNVIPALGRDGSAPRLIEGRVASGERPFAPTVIDIAGRHVIDTLALVQNYDMSKRDMESYSLKYAAQYFGVSPPNRTYVPGDRISWYWDQEPETLTKYALEDVIETRAIADLLSPPSFFLTQMIPCSYSHVVRMGSAAKIESLMLREYIRDRHALPKPRTEPQTTGGYTDIFAVGILSPVLHVDVESLYPSVMLSKNIAPTSDVQTVFQQLLRSLTTMRLEEKQRMKAAKSLQQQKQLDALQSSLKILINSFYGYLGYARGLFNDPSQADVVTKTGQQLLRQMIAHIQGAGGLVIEVDTDGVFFVPPSWVSTPKAEQQFMDELSRAMPEGISVVLDGRYQKMLSYKKKNYALLDRDGEIRVKGSSLTSRSIEPFGREFIFQSIKCLLHDDIAGLHRVYADFHRQISEHKLTVRDFARVEALKDPVEKYSEEVALGKRNRSAAYEVALSLGPGIRPGEKIAFYVTGSDPNPRAFENCRAAEAWDPSFPDENTAYYLRRLDEFSEKFRQFFSPQDYRALFMPDDLFPFNPSGIAVLNSRAAEKEAGSEEPPAPTEQGIWLDE